MDQTFVLLNNQLSFSTEAILSPICKFCQLAWVLDKDPTVWLAGARSTIKLYLQVYKKL